MRGNDQPHRHSNRRQNENNRHHTETVQATKLANEDVNDLIQTFSIAFFAAHILDAGWLNVNKMSGVQESSEEVFLAHKS